MANTWRPTSPGTSAGRPSLAPRTMDYLLNESLGTREDLPILQHALMRTWNSWAEQSQDRSIGLEDYEHIGAVEALCVLGGGKPDPEHLTLDQLAAKRLFQALTKVAGSTVPPA